RQLHGCAAERFGSERTRYAVQFKQDTARLYAGSPEFNRTLALTLTHFSWRLRNRHVWDNPDPEATLALDMPRYPAPSRFDLACGNPLRLHGLQAVGTEVQGGATLGVALDPALEGLAALSLFRLQHCSYSAPQVQRAGRTPEV